MPIMASYGQIFYDLKFAGGAFDGRAFAGYNYEIIQPKLYNAESKKDVAQIFV